MDFAKKVAGRTWRHFMHDSLYRNSIFLMANTAVLAGFGFVFWALATHFYSAKEVGVTATLITASMLISTLSIFGFDNSFIRFLSRTTDYQDYLDTGFTVSAVAAIITSVIYLVVVRELIPKLGFLDNSAFWVSTFIAFMVINTLNNLTNFAFIAFRVTHLVLLINIGFGVFRLIALVLLAHFGTNGLLLSHALATTVALIITVLFMKRYIHYRLRFKVVAVTLRKMWRYTFSSYLSMVFLGLPILVMPSLVISKLGAESSAYYYMVSVIITALNVIPLATSQSLFAEGSWDESALQQHIWKALKIIFSLLLPTITILIMFGKAILSAFGTNYASHGYAVLVLLAIAGVPRVFNYVLGTILRVQHKVDTVAATYLVYALIVLGGSWWGVNEGKGLAIIGWSTLVAEIITALGLTIVTYLPRVIRGAETR